MSTQRRRVLEGDKKLEIPADGVYIEGLDRKVYTVNDWQGGNAANSVIVASGDVKFRIALARHSSYIKMSSANTDTLGDYMTPIEDESAALTDYNGAENTANILKVQPSTTYAAGWCNAYIFPDGKTKGYLPASGQLYLAYENKNAVDAALSACSGTAMDTNDFYWTSTFSEVYRYDGTHAFWRFSWGYYYLSSSDPTSGENVRPFADIS